MAGEGGAAAGETLLFFPKIRFRLFASYVTQKVHEPTYYHYSRRLYW